MTEIEPSASGCRDQIEELTAAVLGQMSRVTLRILEDFAAGGDDTPVLARHLLPALSDELCSRASMIVIESFHRVGVDGWIRLEREDPIERRRHSWAEKECVGGTFVIDQIAHQFGEFRAGFGD